MIVINLKNYKVGNEIIDLIRKIEIYYGKAIVAVPAINIAEISKNTSLSIYAQHVDHNEPGRGTGFILPESLVALGIKGSIINHSEHKLSLADIKKTVKRCNEVGLNLIVCASNLTEVKSIKKLNPYAIAFEDKALISTGKSITSYKSKDIQKFVKELEGTGIIPLCGAGITTGNDVAGALLFGCKGVLVSSVVANSNNPEKFLKEIAALF